MKKYADKRRHATAMRIKVGNTMLCKQEKRNRLTPLFDPVLMVVIGINGRHDHHQKQPENPDQELRRLQVQAVTHVTTLRMKMPLIRTKSQQMNAYKVQGSPVIVVQGSLVMAVQGSLVIVVQGSPVIAVTQSKDGRWTMGDMRPAPEKYQLHKVCSKI